MFFVCFSLPLIPSFMVFCYYYETSSFCLFLSHSYSIFFRSFVCLLSDPCVLLCVSVSSFSLYHFLSFVLAFVLCFCAFIGHLLSNSLSSSLLSLLLVFYGFCISICLLIFYSFCLQEYLFDDFVYLRIYLLLTVNTKNSINDALFLH